MIQYNKICMPQGERGTMTIGGGEGEVPGTWNTHAQTKQYVYIYIYRYACINIYICICIPYSMGHGICATYETGYLKVVRISGQLVTFTLIG